MKKIFFISLILLFGCKDLFHHTNHSFPTTQTDEARKVDKKNPPVTPPANYCSGTHLTNAPFANSLETGIDGTSEAKAFIICTFAQLNQIGSNTQNYNKFFKLMSDITINGTFNMIGECIISLYVDCDPTSVMYSGTFDGNNFTISGLTFNQSGYVGIGLFRSIGTQGVVKNLNVTNTTLSGERLIGIIAGYNAGFLSHVLARGNVTGANYIGGLTGINVHGNIEYASHVGNVTGNNIIGGLVGFNRACDQENFDGTLSFCDKGNISYVTTNSVITGYLEVGGAVGEMFGGILQSATATGSIATCTESCGQLVGLNRGEIK